jgi:hypothetical protein
MSWLITGTEKTIVDPQFTSVSLLLHGNGANGSTTFTDNSRFGHSFTTTGSPTISTTESKFGGSSLFFNGSSSLTTTSAEAFSLGGQDFTIEVWANLSSVSAGRTILSFNSVSPAADSLLFGYANGTGVVFYMRSTSASWDIADSRPLAPTINIGQWHHLAISRSGSSIYAFQDGVLKSTTTSSLPLFPSTNRLFVGTWSSNFANGYIDDLRITKGVARYTANFTPPAAPFPDI